MNANNVVMLIPVVVLVNALEQAHVVINRLGNAANISFMLLATVLLPDCRYEMSIK